MVVEGDSRRSYGARTALARFLLADDGWQEVFSRPSHVLLSLSLFTLRRKENYDTRINSQMGQKSLGLRGGPTLPYIGPTSGLREGGPT